MQNYVRDVGSAKSKVAYKSQPTNLMVIVGWFLRFNVQYFFIYDNFKLLLGQYFTLTERFSKIFKKTFQ